MLCLRIEDCLFRVECLPCDLPLEELGAFGRPDLDEAVRAEVQSQLDAGNQWVWCDVRVSCHHPDLPSIEGWAYLGACCYPSEAEFKRSSGAYADLCKEAFGVLVDEATNLYRRLYALDSDRRSAELG